MNEATIWPDVLAALGWTGRCEINLAETLVDRHAANDRTAFTWSARDGGLRDVGFAELATASAQHASLLHSLGVRPGDRVACVMPRVPEAIVAMLGAFRLGAIHLPIFSGFAADAIGRRVGEAGAKVVMTHSDVRARLPRAWPHPLHVLVAGDDATGEDIAYRPALATARATFAPVLRQRTDPAVLLFTSGSTGPPKAVAIATNFPAAILPALRFGADLREDDVFWPSGDPGWGYGLVCIAVALALRVPFHLWEANPTAAATLDFLVRHRITNLATVPTLLRGLMALGEAEMQRPGLVVRSIASCGEPLNAEVVTCFRRSWGVTPLDQFGSSEHGLPVGNTFAARAEVRPGSMGKPLPGQRIAIIDDAGAEVPTGTIGLIAAQPPPDGLYALGYWNNPAAEAALRRNGWLVTGDLGRQDADGFLWFEGRRDDVIKSAGYRIGPFEVESALLTHPAVAEAAAFGKPDPLRGQIVKALCVLRPGFADSAELREELALHARNTLGAHAWPRELAIVAELPKTNTGKIQRFLLREQELPDP